MNFITASHCNTLSAKKDTEMKIKKHFECDILMGNKKTKRVKSSFVIFGKIGSR